MVDMVNHQMVGSGHYHPVHLEGFGPEASGGVESVACRVVDVPFIFNQLVVIVCIDDSEHSAGNRYQPGVGQGIFQVGTRIEVFASIVQPNHSSFANEVVPLFANKDRATVADGKN